ncbi:hypothetical protein V5799_025973 [Amblyomma americanum]|uniref:Uncharacterized protein n=1 Tax=Amblyomma americanum TaxID=6943 RepID=A0AAQ4DJX0_AMBAM
MSASPSFIKRSPRAHGAHRFQELRKENALVMDSSPHFNWLVVLVAVLSSMTVVPPVNAQDCRQSSQDCDAKQVLSNFPVFNVYVTSDPEPTKYCERYERTSLSDDGTTAEYDIVYRDANGDDTP